MESLDENEPSAHLDLPLGDAPVGIMLIDSAGCIARLNQKARELLGLSANYRPGQRWLSVFGDDTDADSIDVLVDDLVTRSPRPTIFRAPQDPSCHLEFIWQEPYLWIKDITERVRAQQLVDAERFALRALHDATNVVEAAGKVAAILGETLSWDTVLIWLLDGDGRQVYCIQSWNPSSPQTTALEQLSLGTTVTRGQGLPGRVCDDGRSRWTSPILPEMVEARAAAAHQSGQHTVCAVALSDNGKPAGACELYSKLRRDADPAELSLLESIGRALGRFIAHCASTEALRKNEQWARQLAEQAQEDVRARESFLSVAAHELRTPLTTVQVQAQLALRRLQATTDHPATRSVELVCQELERPLNLVRDLLDVARVHSGGSLPLEKSSFDFVELLENTLRHARLTTQKHTFELLSERPVSVYGDRARLEQVVSNLLANAVRYSPNGGPVRLTLITHPDKGHTAAVELHIEDRGLGIPPREQEQIFQHYFTGHGSRYGGLGLGLSVVKNIIDAHGGRINVRSSGIVGDGSVFTLHLPQPSK